MKRSELLERVRKVRSEIGVAEAEVDGLLKAIAVVPGAEKVAVSDAISDAFLKLREAKSRLLELDSVLVDKE